MQRSLFTDCCAHRLLCHLSNKETAQILHSAEDCAASECSVDDVDQLIENLKIQEGILSERMVKIMNIIATLQHVNEKKERKTDDVRQFVGTCSASLVMMYVQETRVFLCLKDFISHASCVVCSYDPKYFPTGWASDTNAGPFDAYDVLEPKKWKPADKK